MLKTIRLATRKSQLALSQTELVCDHLKSRFPGLACEVLPMSTTGDRQQSWSLEEKGGKGLFTKELEDALLRGEADVAVHSAKDLPTELPNGLVICGFLPREVANDVLVLKEGVEYPSVLAIGGPRRRAQIQRRFPNAAFIGMRGSVPTRLTKVAEGDGGAEGTVCAAAGLKRLGITEWPGVTFTHLSLEEMVPAVGQAAIAIECTSAMADVFKNAFDAPTAQAVELERKFLKALGGGCQVAYAAHIENNNFHIFHHSVGYRAYPINLQDPAASQATLKAILKDLNHG